MCNNSIIFVSPTDGGMINQKPQQEGYLLHWVPAAQQQGLGSTMGGGGGIHCKLE